MWERWKGAYLATQGDKPCSVCVVADPAEGYLAMQGDKPCSVRVSADAAEQPVQPHPGAVAAEALPGLPQLSLPSASPAWRCLPPSLCAGAAVSALPLATHR